MASARLVRALATRDVKVRKAPGVSGEVALTFRPLMDRVTGETTQPASIRLSTFATVEPLKRSDVTLENLRESNLADLVRRNVITLV